MQALSKPLPAAVSPWTGRMVQTHAKQLPGKSLQDLLARMAAATAAEEHAA